MGGFSRSPLLREVVRAELSHLGCSIVDVNEPDLAIVTGAVMYFDRSTVFNLRKARLTYGTWINRPFDNKSVEHRLRLAAGKASTNHAGQTCISDCFDVFIHEGDDLPVGGVLKQRRQYPLTEEQEAVTVAVFATPERNPSFVDEKGCFEVGRLTFDLNKDKDFVDRGFRVEFTFGGPELKVKILHTTEEREIAEAVLVMKPRPRAAMS